jgi:hypothetical protein
MNFLKLRIGRDFKFKTKILKEVARVRFKF